MFRTSFGPGLGLAGPGLGLGLVALGLGLGLVGKVSFNITDFLICFPWQLHVSALQLPCWLLFVYSAQHNKNGKLITFSIIKSHSWYAGFRLTTTSSQVRQRKPPIFKRTSNVNQYPTLRPKVWGGSPVVDCNASELCIIAWVNEPLNAKMCLSGAHRLQALN
jgi:hypothetical protein